jgi:hypothetical protein
MIAERLVTIPSCPVLEESMKWLLNIVAVLLVLVGLVWILQGLNIIMGSPMTGHIIWTGLGLVLDVIGIVMLYLANRRRPKLG